MQPLPATAFEGATLIPFPARPARAEAAADTGPQIDTQTGAALVQTLMRLRRPRGLIGAARIGMAGYDRRRALPRLLRQPDLPGPRAALARLLALEAECETARREGRADHDVLRHLDLMIAALAEGRALALAEASASLEQ